MSSITMAKEAPPFVTFDYMEAGVDEEASAKAGRQIPKFKPFATIRQIGDKFAATDKDAEEWLKDIEMKARMGQYNPEWAQRYRMQYDAFLKGDELPRHGQPIKTWAAINREQVLRLIAIGITTVEDLAAQPDQALGMIGLDGRYLRDLAKTFIAQGLDAGKTSKQIANLEQSNRDKDEQIQRMSDRLAALEKQQPLGLPKK